MKVQTEVYQLENQLTLHDPAQVAINLHLTELVLIRQDNEIIECRLTFQVSPELYHRINTEALFNLNPEFRGSLSNGDFLPELDIQLETTLQPDLFPHLQEHASTAEEAAAYLITLSQESAVEPLLNTENWFCLSVKQISESKETGYTTFWNYVNPATLKQPGTDSDQVADGIVNFVKDWTQGNLTTATQSATAELLKDFTNLFDELGDWIDETSPEVEENETASESLLETVIDFFEQEDWPFVQLEDQTTLRFAFRGDNGRWTCYAITREEQKEFIFYSICPVSAPEDKRTAIAEFLTRANYGIVIGNFDLDFSDGEIRYKTSIDLGGDRLSTSLVRQLVYANVLMMDEYLPGIMAVIEGECVTGRGN